MRTQIDYAYRWRGNLRRVISFAVAGGMLFGISVSLESGHFIFWVAGLILNIIVGLHYELRLKQTYRCPKCEKLLKPPKLELFENHEEFVYICTECQIKWRTLTHPPTNSA